MPVHPMILAIAGAASAIFLGYCVYYDHKRRMDPEYRRKLHERRERDQEKSKNQLLHDGAAADSGSPCECGCGKKMGGKPDLSDQAALERYLFHEIKLGEYLIINGRLDEGLTHMANAIELCGQPDVLLQMMEATLPDNIFRPLIQKLQEHAQLNESSEISEQSSLLSIDVDGRSSNLNRASSDTSLPIPLLHSL
ncbi:mitochondrial import receptor subunit TOM20 homolog B-like [Drosophila tropicalis]|uniref:mitochondrial import receptor subunit TOM20 homolog B-like n=1 Tax=Drosophila tropicalis TaxID=46794 RepID=UPI0035ABC24D